MDRKDNSMYHTHNDVFMLLPWHVNETLDKYERRLVDRHLKVGRNWLETGLAQLSPEQRAVVELTHFNGMHYAEIAKIVDCPENTVKTRMFHARKNLASVLEKLEGK